MTLALCFGGGGDRPLVATAVAQDDCNRLTNSPGRRGWTGAQPLPLASRMPQNVRAECYGGQLGNSGYGVRVSWDLALSFPQGLLSGHCLQHSHATGAQIETCSSGTSQTVTAGICFGGTSCHTSGAHYVRVKLTTSCDVDLPWSDTASCTHQ